MREGERERERKREREREEREGCERNGVVHIYLELQQRRLLLQGRQPWPMIASSSFLALTGQQRMNESDEKAAFSSYFYMID